MANLIEDRLPRCKCINLKPFLFFIDSRLLTIDYLPYIDTSIFQKTIVVLQSIFLSVFSKKSDHLIFVSEDGNVFEYEIINNWLINPRNISKLPITRDFFGFLQDGHFHFVPSDARKKIFR